MSTNFFYIKKGEASFNRVYEIINTKNKIIENENSIELSDFKNSITYKNVSFSYNSNPDKKVLKKVDLNIEKGKTIALVGQSGSGKSTLVDLLPRFYDTTDGSILIDNINIKDLTIKSLRSKLGIVNQDAILFNDTISNNIAFET